MATFECLAAGCTKTRNKNDKLCSDCHRAKKIPDKSKLDAAIADGSYVPKGTGGGTDAQPRIKECPHCKGEGSCKDVSTAVGATSIKHSCEYCVRKSSMQFTSLFPVVPCAYCGGKGFHELSKPQQQQQKTDNRSKK